MRGVTAGFCSINAVWTCHCLSRFWWAGSQEFHFGHVMFKIPLKAKSRCAVGSGICVSRLLGRGVD